VHIRRVEHEVAVSGERVKGPHPMNCLPSRPAMEDRSYL
jgi:hypothetical protein